VSPADFSPPVRLDSPLGIDYDTERRQPPAGARWRAWRRSGKPVRERKLVSVVRGPLALRPRYSRDFAMCVTVGFRNGCNGRPLPIPAMLSPDKGRTRGCRGNVENPPRPRPPLSAPILAPYGPRCRSSRRIHPLALPSIHPRCDKADGSNRAPVFLSAGSPIFQRNRLP